MKYIILSAGFLLAACQPQQFNSGVAAAEVGLTASEQLALEYTSLPRCGSVGASSLCSEQATVAKIKAADMTAYTAVKQAEANEALIGAALTAINAFKSTIPGAH